MIASIQSPDMSSNEGRSFVAEKFIERGEIVLEEEPYVHVVSSAFIHGVCAYCCCEPIDGRIYALSASDPIRYCSQECMSLDSSLHSTEATALSHFAQLNMEGSTDPCHLVIRIASQRKLEKVGEALPVDSLYPLNGKANRFPHLLLLQSNRNNISEDILEDVDNVSNHISRVCTRSSIDISSSHVSHLFLAIQCNAHRILLRDVTPVALGIFPMTSMLNHSCNPNCAHEFQLRRHLPPRLIMRALRPIAPQEEITYSYVPLYQSTSARQIQLQSAYSFTCQCDRCNHIGFPDDHVMDVAYVSSETNGAKLQQEIAIVSSLLQKGATAAKAIQTKMQTWLSSADKCGCLHPSHALMLSAYQIMFQAAKYRCEDATLSHDVLEAAIGFGALSAAMILYYTHMHSNEAVEVEIFLAKIIKRSLEDDKDSQVKQYILRCNERDGDVVSHVIALLQHCIRDFYWYNVDTDLINDVLNCYARYICSHDAINASNIDIIFANAAKHSKTIMAQR